MTEKTLNQLTLLRKEYAGTGAKDTPPRVRKLMTQTGELLARRGLTLRSGGGEGADSAFEEGCDRAEGEKRIFLPWKGFSKNPSNLTKPSAMAEILAADLHPNWKNCTPSARKIHARICHEILGANLKSPCAFILTWSPEGENPDGGTATAIALAKTEGIPCFRLEEEETFQNWEAWIKENL